MTPSLLLALLLPTPAAATCFEIADGGPLPLQPVDHPTRDLEVAGYDVVSHGVRADGRVELVLAVWVGNRGTVPYAYATGELEPLPFGLDVEIVDGHAAFDALDPGVPVAGWDTVTLAFAPGLRNPVKAALRGNQLSFAFRATEEPQYLASVALLDEATDLAQIRREVDLTGIETVWFSGWTPRLQALGPGSVLTDNPDYTGVNLECGDLPILVSQVVEDLATGEVGIVRDPRPVNAFDLYASFGVAHDLRASQTRGDTPAGMPATECTLVDPEEECVLPPPQLRIEGLELAPGVFFDGMLATGAHASGMTAWFRDGAAEGLELDVALVGWVTVQPRFETSGVLVDAEAPILAWDAPLASIPLAYGVSVGLEGTFALDAVLDGTCTAGIGLGITEYVEIGGTLVHDSSGTTFTPRVSAGPPLLSPPAFDDAAVVDLDGGVRLAIGVEGTVYVEGFPAISASLDHTTRVGQHVSIDPTADVWWSRSTTFAQDAEVAIDVAGIQVYAGNIPIAASEQPLDESAPVAPGAPGDRAETELGWTASADFEQWADDYATGIAVLADGRIASIGTNLFGETISVHEPDGTLAWQITVDGMMAELITATDDGGLAVAGDTGVARLDANGAVVWSAAFDVFGLDFAGALAWRRDDAGAEHLVVVGMSYVTAVVNNPFALSFDGAGTLRWARYYPGPNGGDSAWYGAKFADDGDLLVSGTTDAESFAGEVFPGNAAVVRLDSATGDPLWGLSVESLAFEDLAELADGSVVAVGNKASTVFDQNHAMVVAVVTADGALDWITTYAEDVSIEGRVVNKQDAIPGDTLWDVATAVVPAGDGFTLAGVSGQYVQHGGWLVHLTRDGAPVWWTTWDGAGDEWLTGLADTGVGYAILGTTTSFGERDVFVSHVPREGAVPGLQAELGVRYTQPDIDDFQRDDAIDLSGDAALPFLPQAIDVAAVVTPGAFSTRPSAAVWTAR